MEEKKYIKISLSTLFLIIAIIVIGIMGYMMYQMNFEIKQLSEKVANSEKVTANDTVIENNKVNEIVEEDNENVENTADISAKCKTAFEEYYDLQVGLYSGGSLDVLKKLNLVSEIPAPEQYETTTYEFDVFYKTDIKYSDFKNAMLKYMTDKLFEEMFEDDCAKNVNGYLQITAMSGTATYINIDKFELSSNNNNSYVFNLVGERRYDDGAPKTNINMIVTFEKQNGIYVVSNIEE